MKKSGYISNKHLYIFVMFLLFGLPHVKGTEQVPNYLTELYNKNYFPKEVVLSIKTNFLSLAAITPNIEFEFPIGSTISVNIEGQYSNWLKKNTFCWQVLYGSLEVRYWIGTNYWSGTLYQRKQLSGWFLGAFASIGMYDFQLQKDEGTQINLLQSGGLTCGYSRMIYKNFNLELSLGVSLSSSDYQHYRVVYDELINTSDRYNKISIQPAKAKVSVAWLIHKKKR